MIITSHIIFDNECSFRSKIKEQIESALASYNEVNYHLTINKAIKQHNRYFIKFTIELEGELGDDDTITFEIFDSISALNSSGSKTGGVLKFYDDHQLSINIKYYSSVYQTEMRMREVLFYILWNRYGEKNMYSFLTRFGVEYNEVSKKDCSPTFDHPLFYIMFSRYSELTKFQNLNSFSIPSKTDDSTKYLFKEIKKYDTIDELVLKLKSIWIDNDAHNAFFRELISYLSAVELLRNAVAHNRHIEPKVIENASVAMQQIEDLINDFWEDEVSTPGLDITKEDMIEWFMFNYTDPANGVPYDNSEGGYQYWAGGPYNAGEEIVKQFPNVGEDIIDEAVCEIENDGYEWVKSCEY